MDNDLIFGNGSALETMMNLGIRGIVGLSSQVQTKDQNKIENNTRKTSLLVSTTENIANIINLANKRAEALCRNKRGNKIDTEVICLNKGIEINPNDDKYKGKTIVIKDGNLTLKNYMSTNSQALTILLMQGNFILPDITPLQKNFSANGYIGNEIFANYLKGNFIINGIIQANNKENEIKNKLIIHGKLASFNPINTSDNSTEKN